MKWRILNKQLVQAKKIKRRKEILVRTTFIIVALVLCTSIAVTQHIAPLGRLLDGYCLFLH